MGIDLPVPDHSTLSRRFRKMDINIPVLPAKEALHLMIDPRVLNVYAQEEWNTKVDGIDKGETWRQINIGVNEVTGEIVTNVSEDQVFLQEVVESEIGEVLGDRPIDVPVVPATEAIHQVAGSTEVNVYGQDLPITTISRGECHSPWVDGIGKSQKSCIAIIESMMYTYDPPKSPLTRGTLKAPPLRRGAGGGI